MKQKVYIIADTHFSHENVIKFENRPFLNAEEMDRVMIDNWNKKVNENDLVFHLGDVIVGKTSVANRILPRLNGRKILILGNHDRFTKTKWRRLGFEPYQRYFLQDYLLTHIPVDEEPLHVAVESGFLKGNIHGHTHKSNSHLNPNLYICCCVEWINYTPILFENLIDRNERRNS